MSALEKENILPDRHGIGGNNPPSPMEALCAGLKTEHGDLIERATAFGAMIDRLPNSCNDAETATKLTEAIKSATALSNALEAARKVAKQPHLDAGKAVDAFFANQTIPVEGVKKRMNALLTAYQRKLAEAERERREAEAAEQRRIQREAEALAREQERKAREAREAEAIRIREAAQATAKLAGEARRKAEAEEAARQEAERARLAAEQESAQKAREAAREERERAEAAKAAANARDADMTRAQSDLGAVASLRTTWGYEVTDAAAVPREYLTVDHTKIKAAMKAANKGGEMKLKIPGIKFTAESNTVVR